MIALSSAEIPASRPLDSSFLRRLRSETRNEHERLEKDLDLLRPEFDRPQYERLLERFYGFFKPWEVQVAELLARSLPEFGVERRKTPLLEADLHFLGIETRRLVLCGGLPRTRTLEELLGSLYVTEGSTLGGQIIARHIESRLGFFNGQGYAFFSSYKGEVGRMWRTFQGMLITRLAEGTEDLAVASARETFRLMHDWLCPENVPWPPRLT